MQVFEKCNSTAYHDALLKEAQGLSLLQSVCKNEGIQIRVPQIFSVNQQTLELTAINSKPPKAKLMQSLGEGLAKIHQTQADFFGLQYDNYIGLNPQRNTQEKAWGDFFVKHRLGMQISWIKDQHVKSRLDNWLTDIEPVLKRFLDDHNDGPSLLHGDLWSGNAIFDEYSAWLIDPAVYFGDREVDLAMTEMFGGFTAEFYQGYDHVWPKSKAYPLKKSIYNLYHFLNHYNLFGDSYLPACTQLTQAIAAGLD